MCGVRYLEIAQHNGDLSASDDKDKEHQHQKAENVIVLIHPDTARINNTILTIKNKNNNKNNNKTING